MSMGHAAISSDHSGVAEAAGTRYDGGTCRKPLILPDNSCWRCPVWAIAISIVR